MTARRYGFRLRPFKPSMRAMFSAESVSVSLVFEEVAFALKVAVLVEAVPVLLSAVITVPVGIPVPLTCWPT